MAHPYFIPESPVPGLLPDRGVPSVKYAGDKPHLELPSSIEGKMAPSPPKDPLPPSALTREQVFTIQSWIDGTPATPLPGPPWLWDTQHVPSVANGAPQGSLPPSVPTETRADSSWVWQPTSCPTFIPVRRTMESNVAHGRLRRGQETW